MKMKVLIVGEFRWEIYEKAFYNAFKYMGYKTFKFEWVEYLSNRNFPTSIYYKFQNKYTLGPTITKINIDLINYCKDIKPQLVFIYRGTHLFPSTIKKISELGSIVFGYNNDDPFSKVYPKYYWRHYIKGIKYYDHIFSYRKKNIDDYINIGYTRVSLLRSYYIKSRNYSIEQTTNKLYSSDVMFIGHFENDGRDDYMKSLTDEGIILRIYGDRESWKSSKHFDVLDHLCGPIVQVRKDYNLAINSTKIALVFLSKINNDSYTRRCFEIPATKTFMLSEYTEDLDGLFKDHKEAVYFKNKRDFIDKVKFYLKNENLRKEIASAGYRRVINDGHEVQNRIKEIVQTYESLLK
jgi:spore maturation protein CgeB